MVSAGRSGLGVTPLQSEGAAAAPALAAFEAHLKQFIEQHALSDPVAHHIAYHFGFTDKDVRQGKRLRPRLAMAAARAFGAAAESTLEACTAIELLHNYSLVHDDIEDADRLRHGRETLWAAFGLAHGINAGDAVGALAHLALAPAETHLGAGCVLQMSIDLARANLEMCQGQALDLALEGGSPSDTDTYIEMIRGKTAALFGCAAAMGARCANAEPSEIERCRSIGCFFGLAFQIADDVSGIWSSSAATGKAAAGDLERRKKTFPIVWALQNDPQHGGRTIAQLYGSQEPLSEQSVTHVREALQACGAYEAARAAADNYFEQASYKARGLTPLSDLLFEWRPRL